MKRYVLIIGLWAACIALPSEANAQWGFTAIFLSEQYCGGIKPGIPLSSRNYSGFLTKAECEAKRAQISNSISTIFGCNGNWVCLVCTGPAGGNNPFGDGSGSSAGKGNANITATNQGDPFYTGNPVDATQDAYEQKRFQNEALFGIGKNENVSQYPLTDDKDYNNQIVKILPKGTLAKGRGIEGIDLNATPKIFEQPALGNLPLIESYVPKQPINNAIEENTVQKWWELGIDAAGFATSVLGKGSAVGYLVTVNVNLYKELVNACYNPTEYMGLDGTVKIFKNAIKGTATDVVVGAATGAVASKIVKEIPVSKQVAERMAEQAGHISDAIDLGRSLADALY